MTDRKKMGTRELVSIVVAGTLVLSAVVFWIMQIQGVLEMFKLQSGG